MKLRNSRRISKGMKVAAALRSGKSRRGCRSRLPFDRRSLSEAPAPSASPPPFVKMKPYWGFILSSLYCAASAAASSSDVGRVYVWDSTTKGANKQLPSLVNPETARLIFAQRLGLSQFHNLKNANEEVIRQLNQYGGTPQQLFGRARESNNAHAIIIVEGVENAEGEHYLGLP